jgi:hypothetical protein
LEDLLPFKGDPAKLLFLFADAADNGSLSLLFLRFVSSFMPLVLGLLRLDGLETVIDFFYYKRFIHDSL